MGISSLFNKVFDLETVSTSLDETNNPIDVWTTKSAGVPCWEQIDTFQNTAIDGKFEFVYLHRFICDPISGISIDPTTDRIEFNEKYWEILSVEAKSNKVEVDHYKIMAREII